MNQHRFDAVTRAWHEGASRRRVLRGLGGVGLGWGATWLTHGAEAKTKQGKDKPKPNKYGCLEVGDACGRSSQCCSGLCEGKPGMKTCRAHGTGTCNQSRQGFCTNPDLLQVVCNNRSDCGCFRTTAGSNFCAELFHETGSQCADCQSDADCEALGLPSGTACAPVSKGRCAGLCDSGMACLVRCGAEIPA
jgi:hypothetical protein